jgi:hypothetical protein
MSIIANTVAACSRKVCVLLFAWRLGTSHFHKGCDAMPKAFSVVSLMVSLRIFLTGMISVGCFTPRFAEASTFTVIGPCDAKPILQVPFQNGPGEKSTNTLGDITVSLLQKHQVPFQGDRSGIKSILNSPVGDDAIEVLSNSELRAYGWCVSVNGQQPAEMPDTVILKGSQNQVIWFYAYSRYDRGVWKDYCTPSFKLKTLPVCRKAR